MKRNKLYLSEKDRKIAGVCGGISEAYDIDSTLCRLVWVFVVLATGFVPGILLYLLAIIIIPESPTKEGEGKIAEDDFKKHPLDEN